MKHPFPPESDEVKIADEKKDEPKTDEKKPTRRSRGGSRGKKDATPEDKKTTVPVPAAELVIDFDGLAPR